MTNPAPATDPVSIRLVGTCPTTVWGLSSVERMRRVGRRLGVPSVAADDVPATGRVLFIRADILLEDRLVKALLAREPMALIADIGGTAQVVAVRSDGDHEAARAALGPGMGLSGLPLELAVARPDAAELCYDDVLRKRAVPFVLQVTEANLRAIEWRMFGASYKGATDFVTKWVWPWPAFHATRLCARLGLSPNMVTLASFVLVLAAFALFWQGQFGLGIVAAWAMTFLDTVDGKLARVTVTSSKWGNVFDHGIDMVHPPFWYWAWLHGLGAAAGEVHLVAFWIIVAGYVLGRLEEGAFLGTFKFEIHVWRPFDYWLRAFTARRNPNLAILMVAWASGAPDIGFLAVAAWTVVCLALHGVRVAQAMILKAHNVPVRSYLSAG